MSEILIKDVLDSKDALGEEDGNKLFFVLLYKLKMNQDVKVSFKYMEVVTLSFLNASFGQLYGVVDANKIKRHIDVKDINDFDRESLSLSVEAAKTYFNNHNTT